MRILFDQGTPVPLRAHLVGHTVDTAFELGWSTLQNGDLLDSAESEGFELLITTDRSLRHQQNLSERNLAVLILLAASWPRIQQRIDDILSAIDRSVAGSWIEVKV